MTTPSTNATKLRDLDTSLDARAVTRFEVIDHRDGGGGRVFVAQPCSVELSFQDDRRTLKVFVAALETTP